MRHRVDRSHLNALGALLGAALLIVSTTGCSLSKRSLELEVSRLNDRLGALETVETDLRDPSFPPGERHVELFVSYGLLNSLLMGADGLSMSLPEDPGTRITVDHLELEPVDGIASLKMQAHAVRGDVRLDVVIKAQGVIDPTTSPPSLRVRIQDVAPVFRWKSFSFGRWRLARLIATTQADQWALNRLSVSLPLEQAFAIDAPPIHQVVKRPTSRGNGSWVEITVARPAFSLERVVRIDRVLILRDGIHVFGSVIKES